MKCGNPPQHRRGGLHTRRRRASDASVDVMRRRMARPSFVVASTSMAGCSVAMLARVGLAGLEPGPGRDDPPMKADRAVPPGLKPPTSVLTHTRS